MIQVDNINIITTLDYRAHIYNAFTEKFPKYVKLQKEIIRIIKKYSPEDSKILKEELSNECFQFLVLGTIDRLYYDTFEIEKEIYDKIHKIIVKLTKFNYFNFYHKCLNSNLEDIDIDKIIKEISNENF